MSIHFADRFLEAVESKGAPICAGIDPVLGRLPAAIAGDLDEGARVSASEAVGMISEFVGGVFEAVADHVPIVKIQSACFERYLHVGLEAEHELTKKAEGLGLLVINDAKRGDIGISSAHYAAGCFGGTSYADVGELRGADALTVSAYMGGDTLGPFVDVAVDEGKGLFALVRTSNPGSDMLQNLAMADGRTVAQAVAEMVAEVGKDYVGEKGYSLLGAVVGATKASDIAGLRERMPEQLFLVPGYGAQGGGAEDVKACFKSDGTGAIITASRSILYAYEKSDTGDWKGAIEEAAVEMKGEIGGIIG